MLRILAVPLIWLTLAIPANAQTTARIDALVKALGLPEMIEVMREEGMVHGDDFAQDMFPDQATGRWQAMVAEIYDPDRITGMVYADFEGALGPETMDEILAFFQSPVGAEIIALEISARRALLDTDLSDDNDARVAELRAEEHPRMAQLAKFIEVNDLLEANVVGALNSNFAFFSGLVDGGAYDRPMSSEEILTEVWSQEDEIRADTEIWIYGFLSMAYTPLDDDEMQAYIAFSETTAGQKLNTALFSAFNKMFDDVSYALGRGAAQLMGSEAL